MLNNYLQEFNDAKNSNNWTKATEIIENICQQEIFGENDHADGHLGRKIAEQMNVRDEQAKKAISKLF